MTKAKFGSSLLLCQMILVILYIVFTEDVKDVQQTDITDNARKDLKVYHDIHVYTFLGFGLILTFLRRYSRGMLVHVFLIGAVVIQWATLLQGFFSLKVGKIEVNLNRMITADFAVISVLVSIGAIMGKCNSLQLLAVALIETFFFAINEAVNLHYLKVIDFGRSMIVHAFGAYFGLAVSRVIFSRKVCTSQALSMSYRSEMYSFIGTLFLWTYWPSVNCAFVETSLQNRALTNTLYALAASCTLSFALSIMQSNEGKFNIFHLQNSTLAGGVAIGSIAAMSLTPWGAVIVGIVGSLGSILGYKQVVPKCRHYLRIHDTRGVHATHGIPGIISGVASVFTAVLANDERYGSSLYKLYPARAPLRNTTKLIELNKVTTVPCGENRTAATQALYQLACLGITIALAVGGGLLTGYTIKLKFFDPVVVAEAFDDHDEFEEQNCIDVVSDYEYEMDEVHAPRQDVVRGKRRCSSFNQRDNNPRGSIPVNSEHSLISNYRKDSGRVSIPEGSEYSLLLNQKRGSHHVTPHVVVTSDVETHVIGEDEVSDEQSSKESEHKSSKEEDETMLAKSHPGLSTEDTKQENNIGSN